VERPPGRRCAVRCGNTGLPDALQGHLRTQGNPFPEAFLGPLTVAPCKRGGVVLIVLCRCSCLGGMEIDRVWVFRILVDRVVSAAMQTEGCKGRGPVRMKRGCLRVVPVGTDVTGVSALPERVVVRCVSTAEASLSLSLSLCSQFSCAKSGAFQGLLAGRRRACERGVWSFSPARGLFERRRHSPSPVAALEEAPSRVPTRAGARSAERRGSYHAGSRRSSCVAVSVKQVRISSRSTPRSGHIDREETSGSCAGSYHAGSRRSPSYCGLGKALLTQRRKARA
jgi:hypothetical protein